MNICLHSVLQTDHEYSTNQATLLTQENKRLREAYKVEKESCENWRSKCHEILDAVEKTSVVTSMLSENSAQGHSMSSSTSSYSSKNPNRSISGHMQTKPSKENSSSTFYSNEQNLFSPPGSSLHIPHNSAPLHSSRNRTTGSSGNTPLMYNLDSHYPLIEQADVITQSPPTPYVIDGKHTSLIHNSSPHSSVEGSPSLKCQKNMTDHASRRTTTRDQPNADNIPKSESSRAPVSEGSHSMITSPKVIEAIDPRELDDSTLYKMMLEAENEIDDLSPDDSSTDGERKRRQSDADFLATVDLRDAIAHGQGLMDAGKENSVNSDSSPPKRRSKISVHSPNPSQSHSKSPSQFESVSYNTPSKSGSAANHFSKSLHLQNLSASKTTKTTEWTQYFTRGIDKKSDVESPYDKILRQTKVEMGSTKSGTGNENMPPMSSSGNILIPISPIPLLEGQ